MTHLHIFDYIATNNFLPIKLSQVC